MKKTLLAVTLAALTSGAATTALAADPKAPAPDFEISGNFGLFSDYRFRGISQTDRKAALQGGFDFTHKSGFYVGNWNSNISSSFTAGANVENDIYAGIVKEVGPVELNLGVLRYIYPGATATAKPDTTEVYLGVTYGPISYKYSHSTTNYFGANSGNSKGSSYQEINASFDLTDSISVSAHAGRTNIAKTSTGDFSDYRIGLSYALPDDYSIGLTYFTNSGLSSNEKETSFTNLGRKLYDNAAVISLSKTF